MNAKRTDKLRSLDLVDRRLVLIARQANEDTYSGGCHALVVAENDEERDVVSQVYSRSSGKVPDSLDAYECYECGCVHRGREAAELCCQNDESELMEELEA